MPRVGYRCPLRRAVPRDAWPPAGPRARWSAGPLGERSDGPQCAPRQAGRRGVRSRLRKCKATDSTCIMQRKLDEALSAGWSSSTLGIGQDRRPLCVQRHNLGPRMPEADCSLQSFRSTALRQPVSRLPRRTVHRQWIRHDASAMPARSRIARPDSVGQAVCGAITAAGRIHRLAGHAPRRAGYARCTPDLFQSVGVASQHTLPAQRASWVTSSLLRQSNSTVPGFPARDAARRPCAPRAEPPNSATRVAGTDGRARRVRIPERCTWFLCSGSGHYGDGVACNPRVCAGSRWPVSPCGSSRSHANPSSVISTRKVSDAAA